MGRHNSLLFLIVLTSNFFPTLDKMAKRVSKIAKGKRAKYAVFVGRKEKTVGGIKKADLMKNKNGKIVTKKSSARGKKNKFMNAVIAARKALGIKGFQAVGGKTAKGQ